jgi:hypothetical protein
MENSSVTLPVNALHEESYCVRRWNVQLPNEHTVKDMIQPSYWCHISRRLNRGDIITGTKQDNSTFYEFLVVEPLRTATVVRLLREVNLDSELQKTQEIVEDVQKSFLVKWISPSNKWGIIRKTDSQMIKDGIATQEEANEILKKEWKNYI